MIRRLLYILLLLPLLLSCNIDEVIEGAKPQIELDSATGIYTVKQGRELRIAPRYTNVEGATFVWSIEGVEVCHERAFVFDATEQLGRTYITLTVTNDAGSATEQIRVDVVELEQPSLSLAGADEGFTVVKGESLALKVSMRKVSLPTSVVWRVNGEEVCYDMEYVFEGRADGEYSVEVCAKNEDGEAMVSTTIKVVAEQPFEWSFERTQFNLATGRRVRLAPTFYTSNLDVRYTFSLDGEVLQSGTEPTYIFDKEELGIYDVELSAIVHRETDEEVHTQMFKIRVHADEDKCYRAATATSSPLWSKVFEYTPAPGQFINDTKMGGFDGSQTTAESAAKYAEQRLARGNWVSLGGFGGYIVVGFDHSIVNSGGYDFGIGGNAFDGSSEPGIVWVMQDENGDGKPNDTWYELVGSESGKSETKHDYAVTYYRPSDRAMSVQWRDSEGKSGEVEYLAETHNQDYYYPLWITSNSYTLRGTRLKERNYDSSGSGTYWEQLAYDWGYADNRSTEDMVEQAGACYNRFKISNAVDAMGGSVHLKYIDFIKVQTACNTNSGWLGENSTEVLNFVDYSISAE